LSTFARRTSRAGLSRPRMDPISAAVPDSASSLAFGTARTSAGDPSGRVAGTARRCRPPGCTSRPIGRRTGKPDADWRAGNPSSGRSATESSGMGCFAARRSAPACRSTPACCPVEEARTSVTVSERSLQ
jgi:hypothetical protein